MGLWDEVVQRTSDALRTGALQPIDTTSEVVADGGIPFVVRLVSSLATKEETTRERPAGFNPFLPPDPALVVRDLSATHVAVLNKFNVVPHHLLIVTRDFEDQDELLSRADFEALWACMRAYDGLGFYNGGGVAGASQRHKHLQIVPVPLGDGRDRTPVDAAVRAGRLPFAHAIAPYEDEPAAAHTRYLELLARVGRRERGAAYNFLATRDFLLVVPRTRERYDAISINAMGFAGSLLVKNEAQRGVVREVGPIAILKSVSEPR